MVNFAKNDNSINRPFSNRFLVITFSILVLVIIGLITSIIIVNISQNELANESALSAYSTDASDIATEIIERYEEDGQYTIEDATNDFSTALDSLEGDDKVELAIEYALFTYEYGDGPQSAFNILDSYRDLVSEETEFSYYFTYTNIYEDMGDTTNAAKYYNILAEKYPEAVDPYDIAKQKEFEYENSAQ